MNNLEELMAEWARSSVDLKRKLYRREEAASTCPEGADGPWIEMQTAPAVESVCSRTGSSCASSTGMRTRKAAKGAKKGLSLRHGMSCSNENQTRRKGKRHSLNPEMLSHQHAA
jgi:hypothetical protein